jgi:opacity protein-like surface antigen
VRYEVPMQGRVSPYVLGGLGVARLSPTAQFTYSSGTLPDGSTPAAGADVTDRLVTAGYFTAPAASNAFMFTLGGGVDVPVARHWAVDVGYRFSRFARTVLICVQTSFHEVTKSPKDTKKDSLFVFFVGLRSS